MIIDTKNAFNMINQEAAALYNAQVNSMAKVQLLPVQCVQGPAL